MKLIKTFFWNSEQARLRAAYRIISQIIFFILIGQGLRFLIKNMDPDVEFSSSAPLWFFIAYASVTLFSGVGSVWITGRFIDRRLIRDFGFQFDKVWWIDFLFGMGLGVFLMTGIFFVELSLDWIKITELYYLKNPENLFILPLSICIFVFICVSISEEIVTRGYLLTNLAEGLNFKFFNPKAAIIIACIISSAVFGIGHMDNLNATYISTFNIVFAGLFLGIGYILSGRLAIPIGIHFTWNLFQANIFGFPVSGITIPSEIVTVFKIEQLGPELLTGGAFGPEAGLLGLFAILFGIILTLVWIRIRNGSIRFHIPLAYFQNKNQSKDII